MKNYRYDFIHNGKEFTCYTRSLFNAVILFMAMCINAGLDYKIDSVNSEKCELNMAPYDNDKLTEYAIKIMNEIRGI